ncbi:MAG: D-Ala-D-Ala carboxypeptidase family metallohydrolase [Arenicellales bacterium]
MSIRLSRNFILSEFTTSQIAARRGIDNSPGREVIDNLHNLAIDLEVVREQVLGGSPVIISSGYRSPKLNVAADGSNKSDHTRGYAADFICPSFGTPRDVFEAIRHSGIEFDQLIFEFGYWVHLSFAPRLRQQVLIASFENNEAVYRFAA